jgi:hypothetical protein
MTNDPASIAAALRSLAVYAVCAVLAIIIGVLMTNPLTYSALGFAAVVCVILFLPVLLKYHHPLMILSFTSPLVAFFVKGSPSFFLVMVAISLTISVTERALNQPRFINVPQAAWPLICLIGVVLITAKMTGGIGLKAFGSDVYGGKKYVFLIVGILSYFAITARPIPSQKANLYIALFFLGGTLNFIKDLYPFSPGFLHPVFWAIPPTYFGTSDIELGTTRLTGTAWAATAVINALMARYGMRGIFLGDKLWRPIVFFLSLVLIFFGGFRSALVITGATVLLQFFLEGMHRTKLMPFFILFVIAGILTIIPLGAKLPYTFQRTLAFVPESIVHLDSGAREEAQGSLDWRLDMWQALLPQIPKHLLLGKGYAITMEDWASMGPGTAIQSVDAGSQALALSSDYHSGPLSVILPFGIWGTIAFLWFLAASISILYNNYRYGDPALKTANTLLFTYYVVSTLDFFFIFGDLANGMATFAGMLGLSVALNRGVCRAPVEPAKNIPFSMRFANVRSRPKAAFRPPGSSPRPI